LIARTDAVAEFGTAYHAAGEYEYEYREAEHEHEADTTPELHRSGSKSYSYSGSSRYSYSTGLTMSEPIIDYDRRDVYRRVRADAPPT
jgi:hypothetical protein